MDAASGSTVTNGVVLNGTVPEAAGAVATEAGAVVGVGAAYVNSTVSLMG